LRYRDKTNQRKGQSRRITLVRFFGAIMQKDSETPPVISQKKPLLKGHCKRRGETAELAFMLRAASLGFGVSKPWGESDRYDVILDSGHRLWRVQVRSTEYELRRRYRVGTTVTGRTVLSVADIDVLAAYIVPLDILVHRSHRSPWVTMGSALLSLRIPGIRSL
jgi:hypothetical protein